MKKRTWLLAMLLVCALAFAGCTSQQKPTGEDAQKEDQQEEQLTEEKTEEEQPESPEAGENADQAEDAQQPEEEEKDQAQSSGQGSQDTASKPSGGQGTQKPAAPSKPEGGQSNSGSGSTGGGNQPSQPAPQPEPEPEPAPTPEPEPEPKPQPGKTAKEIADALLAQSAIGAGNVSDMGELGLMSAFYPTLDLSKMESYCVKGPMMNVKAGEVAVFQVKDSADVPAVKQVLQQRAADVAKSFEHYLQDQYEFAQKAQVCTKGNYVALIIDGNAAALAQLFDSLAA